MSLRKRVEALEDRPRIIDLKAPAEGEAARRAREEFRAAQAALRARTGDERRDHDPADPVVDELARTARERFRAYIRVTRGGHREH